MLSTPSHIRLGSLSDDHVLPSSPQELSAETNPLPSQNGMLGRSHQPPRAPRKRQQSWRRPTATILHSTHTSSRDVNSVAYPDYYVPDRRSYNASLVAHHSSEKSKNSDCLPTLSQRYHSNLARAISQGRNSYTHPSQASRSRQFASVFPPDRSGSRQQIPDSTTKAMARSTKSGVPSYSFVDASGRRQEQKETFDKQKDKKPIQGQDKNSSVAAKIADIRPPDTISEPSVRKDVMNNDIVSADDTSTGAHTRNEWRDKKSLNSTTTHMIPKVAKAKFEDELQGRKRHKRKRNAKSESLSPNQASFGKEADDAGTIAINCSKDKSQNSSAKRVKLQFESGKRTNERVKTTEPVKPVIPQNLDARDRASKLPTRQQNSSVTASETKTPRVQKSTVEKSTPFRKHNVKTNLVTDASDGTDTSDSSSSDSDGSSDEDSSSNNVSVPSASDKAGDPLNSLGANRNKAEPCIKKNTVHGKSLVAPKSETIDEESHASIVLTGGTASRKKSPKSKKDRIQYLEIMLKNQHYEIMQLRAIISHYGLKGIQVDEALIRMRDKQTVEEVLLSIQGFVVSDQDASI